MTKRDRDIIGMMFIFIMDAFFVLFSRSSGPNDEYVERLCESYYRFCNNRVETWRFDRRERGEEE